MTALNNLLISENRIKALAKKGIESVEDVQQFFPRKYYDFSAPAELIPQNQDKYIAIIGTLDGVSTDKKNNVLMLKAKVTDEHTQKKLNVMWIGSYYLKDIIENWIDRKVIVCGKLTYFEEYHSFHMNNPVIFDKNIEKNLRIYPVYRKMKGISEEFMEKTIETSLSLHREETIPVKYRDKYHLMEINKAIRTMHHPESMQELEQAKKRFTYEKLLSFAMEIEKEDKTVSKGTIFNIKTLKNTNDYIETLPFSLTQSQQTVFQDMKQKALNGIRINALVQGDVGAGKTVQAFLMMFAMADSGYQSVIMAPTQILAQQHYEKLKESADKYGYEVAFLSGETKGKEKKELLAGIESGKYTFVVGTHSVINPSIAYKQLALIIIDEEHKFGVAQRNLLTERAKQGVHCINMSGTPIPRTLASTMYGTSVSVYDLEVPAIRKPIQTAVFNNDIKICEFIYKKILEGQQAYVVCPWIEDESETSGIQTVEASLKSYSEFFKQYPEVKIGCVTGKMKPDESGAVIDAFMKRELQILISTTVIEVGVNVPNANVIVINNAERFGLAQLHQLRGRVGRGSDQGYCILKSAEKDNPRLQIMCKTTNGLEIATEDMKLRGTGDLLGTEQSGKNEYIDLIIRYPNMYKKVKEDAREIVEAGIW